MMGTKFGPMLAADSEGSMEYFEKALQQTPLLGSYKLDGIRCIKHGQPLSRTLKPIRNNHIRNALQDLPDGIDGELIVGLPYGEGVMSRAQSGVMSEGGVPDFKLHVFDDFSDPGMAFQYRCTGLIEKVLGRVADMHCVFVEQKVLTTLDQLVAMEEEALGIGYEGLILRRPNAAYKFGRATLREMGMIKLKRFVDDEATIVGMVELMHNENEATTDARGFTVRSSHKGNKTPGDMLGAFVCESKKFPGVQFEIGSGQGLDHALRRSIWYNQEEYMPKTIKYKYLPIGTKDKPRHPIFLGFRHQDDMS